MPLLETALSRGNRLGGPGRPREAYSGIFHFLSLLIFKQQLSAFWFQGFSGSGLGQLIYTSPVGLNTKLTPCVSCRPESSLAGREVLSPDRVPIISCAPSWRPVPQWALGGLSIPGHSPLLVLQM